MLSREFHSRIAEVDILSYEPPLVCGAPLLVFVLICITLCPFQLCNHLDGEEKAGCLAFIVFRVSC